jgi:hypothetical protein
MSSTYTIEWKAKPLGFSIVMDTTGKNAYVSSIQKEDNIKKGLKLAAQIVEINGQQAKNIKHQAILEMIKGATLPMNLKFQPRSFANETEKKEEKKSPHNASCLVELLTRINIALTDCGNSLLTKLTPKTSGSEKTKSKILFLCTGGLLKTKKLRT